MKVLVIGSGGREHALVWKIAQSPRLNRIFCAPGNAGIARLAECLNIKAEDIPGLLDFARKDRIDLTVVGPEAPLTAGLVDHFEQAGLRVFGPSQAAAEIEGSKVFCKELLRKYGIPTGGFAVFNEPVLAKEYVREQPLPVVLKAEGLAAGKGVIIAQTVDEAVGAIDRIMVEREFGAAGDRLLIEECLVGQEASVMAFVDGTHLSPMVPAQDHKRVFDSDEGPNTGGMGAYSPVPAVTEDLYEVAVNRILQPTVEAMAKEGRTYRGVLYAGVMLTAEGPKVLEYNCRFGDPETQVVLPRLNSDLLEIMEACVDGSLDRVQPEWSDKTAVCVVMASGGYPGDYEKGKDLQGLQAAAAFEGVTLFHAGTTEKHGCVVTDGGRVLGVTALGDGFRDTIEKVYSAAGQIRFEGMHLRQDIGRRALEA